jgi:hypothetical protein
MDFVDFFMMWRMVMNTYDYMIEDLVFFKVYLLDETLWRLSHVCTHDGDGSIKKYIILVPVVSIS